MQSVVTELVKYVLPLVVASIGFLLARLSYLGQKVKNLEAKAKEASFLAELQPLDTQIEEVQKNVEKDRLALNDSLTVHKGS